MPTFAKIIAIVFCCIYAVRSQLNNVCKTIRDYETLYTNSENCWYSHYVSSNTLDIANADGYLVQSYSVITEDGYINTLYRLPRGKTASECNIRQPVYLKHGIMSTSEIFVDVGNRSLAYYLAERCFDVWLGNARGTLHSKGHVNYTINDPEYNDYSFHEVGVYDVSADINFIREIIGNKTKIIYIGHSMGTTTAFVYASVKNQEAAENLAGIISLAPVAFLTNIGSPVKYAAPFWEIFRDILFSNGDYRLFDNPLVQTIIETLNCDKFPMISICQTFSFLIMGHDNGKTLAEDLPTMSSYRSTGGATKTLLHYAQLVVSKQFQYYDYGKQNLDIYGSSNPPEYDLGKISIPVHLIYGSEDLLSSVQDVSLLYEAIKTEKSALEVDYNHVGFLHAKDLITNLYPILMEKINKLTGI